jgi:hypothetical protein
MKPIKLSEELDFWWDIFPEIFFKPYKLIFLRLETLDEEHIRVSAKASSDVYIYDIRDGYNCDCDEDYEFDPNNELYRLCFFFIPLANEHIFRYYLNVLFTFFYDKYSMPGKTVYDNYIVNLFGRKEDENGFIGDKRVLLAMKPKDADWVKEEIDKDSLSDLQKGYRFYYAIPVDGKPKMFQADIKFIKLDFLNKEKNSVNFTVVFDKSKYQDVKIKDANHDHIAKVYCDYIQNKYHPHQDDDFLSMIEAIRWLWGE